MITYHRANASEAHEIKKLLYKTWTSTYSDIYSPEVIDTITSDWHSIKLLTKQIKSKAFFFAVAKADKKIVGMCNAILNSKGDIINIQRIHVSPYYQRRGIGSGLMQEALKHFSKAKKIDLEVEKQNFRALAFYKKLGFKEVGKKIFAIKNVKLPCIVMEKTI